jgi:hypothetical protein
MATSVEAVQAAGNLESRVSFFVIKGAVAVMSESIGTANHAERADFANKVFVGDYDLSSYTYAVLTNPTNLSNLDLEQDDYGINDADLEFTVSSMYNAFAGVST